MHFRQVFGQVSSLEWTIAAVVFGLVILAMLVAFGGSWYRRRRGMGPSRLTGHNKLEGSYLLALAGIAVFLITVSFSTNASFWSDPRPALTVRATGFQWCWDFAYAGQRVSVTAPCAGGRLPTLVEPAGRAVRIEVPSRDEIHSFWLPGLRVKMDAYPGHLNYFTLRVPRGRWLGHCAQYCGLYHYGMMFDLEAVPAAQFDRWLHARGGPAQAVVA